MLVEGVLIFAITVLLVLIGREVFRSPPKTPARVVPKPTEKVKPRDLTIEELQSFDGNDDKPIYIAVAGDVYDISQARAMYGPGSSYHVFAGNDASYGLGTGRLDADAIGKSIDELTASEKDTLFEWKRLYDSKYPLVGKLVTEKK